MYWALFYGFQVQTSLIYIYIYILDITIVIVDLMHVRFLKEHLCS